jgi:hypothetical protein
MMINNINKTTTYKKLNTKGRLLFGLGLWCLTQLSTMFPLYRGDQFYWWRKLEYLEKTTDFSQVSDNVVSTMPLHDRDSN